MTQKRAIKLMMAAGIPRNMARIWLRNNSNAAKFPVKWVAEDEIWATKIWGVPKNETREETREGVRQCVVTAAHSVIRKNLVVRKQKANMVSRIKMVCGCRHPWNWIYKRYMMHTDEIGEMGLDMGIETSFTPEELEYITKMCKYIIGLKYRKPFERRGKRYYRPPINGYYNRYGDKLLDRACMHGIVGKQQDTARGLCYFLTSTGLSWLGRRIGVVIREIE